MKIALNYPPPIVDQRTLGSRSIEEIKNEPMFFSSSLEYAIERGGPITKEFLEPIKVNPLKGIFDSRVHMLMPGWYPCIPGWHLDDIPRTRSDGQPDHANMKYKAEHVMGLVDCGTGSLTEYLEGPISLEDVPRPAAKPIYGTWNNLINGAIEYGSNTIKRCENLSILWFDWRHFHRGAPATGSGWRWFGRVTFKSERTIFNEIRQQVQCYLPSPEIGW